MHLFIVNVFPLDGGSVAFFYFWHVVYGYPERGSHVHCSDIAQNRHSFDEMNT